MSRDSGFGPAVLDGQIRYTSVSQIEKHDPESFGGCERRWWFRYVGGLPEKQTKRQALGTQVHAQIEHYLRTGEDVLGELARAGKRFLPAPMPVAPGLDVEVPVGGMRELTPGGFRGAIDSELTCAGVPVVGFVDAINARQLEVNDAGERVVERGVVEAVDWKSTKRIDSEVDPETGIVTAQGYGKTPEELSRTHQMVGYGVLLAARFPWAHSVRLSHGIFQTSGPRKASKRSALVTVDEVRARWRNRSEPVVERMKATARATSVASVPVNLKACKAYGGCPYVEACPRDAKAVLRAMFEGGESMGLLDRVRPKANAEAPAPTATSAVNAEIAALEAEEAKRAAGQEPAAPVTPPDAPAPSAVAELPDELPAPGECQSEKQIQLDVDAIATKKHACPCGTTVKVKPTKLGDGNYYALVPKHEKPAPKVEAAAPSLPPATLRFDGAKSPEVKAAEAASVAVVEVTKAAPPFEGIVLYMDSIEHGVVAQRLEPYAYKKAAELAAHEGAPDVRCAPEKSALAFGKWKGALAGLVRLEPPPPGVYAISMANEIGAVVAEALIPMAARVVQGVR
jgi:hypothetical protein